MGSRVDQAKSTILEGIKQDNVRESLLGPESHSWINDIRGALRANRPNRFKYMRPANTAPSQPGGASGTGTIPRPGGRRDRYGDPSVGGSSHAGSRTTTLPRKEGGGGRSGGSEATSRDTVGRVGGTHNDHRMNELLGRNPNYVERDRPAETWWNRWLKKIRERAPLEKKK
jgi:hypothetical protein